MENFTRKVKKIKKISNISNRDVYDITVNKNHNFFANSVLVHNCVEIGMYAYDENGESGFEFCNLCEINGKKATNEKDFYDMCRAAAIIGTIQASYATFDYLSKSTERIVQREALLGVSMTGMMDNPHITFDKEIQRKGAKLILDVNEEIALKIGVNKCARSTCVKPAGCLDANTSIRTKNGKKTLIEIFEEQGYSYDEIKDLSDTWLELKKPIQIFNENNELENVSKLYVNGKIKTYEIPLEDGSIIKSTPWHKFKLYNGEWKRADELKEGDDILEYNKNYVYADYIPKQLV
jgi:hypothetical protein